MDSQKIFQLANEIIDETNLLQQAIEDSKAYNFEFAHILWQIEKRCRKICYEVAPF